MKILILSVQLNEVFPSGSVVKNLPANAEEVSSIPGSRRFPEEGNGNPFQYSCLGMKSFTSFILTVSNSLRGSKLFEYLKLPVPLEAGRL